MTVPCPRLLSIKVHSQLSDEANALGIAQGFPTMLCGWFATALAGMACERIPTSGRLPLTALLQLIRDMRSAEVVIPLVRDRLRATRAWRDAYIKHHASEFKTADGTTGGSIAPTDPATVRGFSESCAGCWEVADLLRSATPGTPAAAVAFVRQAMWTPETAIYYTESADIACERGYLEDETPFRAGGPLHAPDYAPYFLDVPTGSPLVDALAAAGSDRARVEPVAAIENVRRPGVMLGLDALATLVAGGAAGAAAAAIPRVFVADLFGHFVCAIAVEVVEEDGDASSSSSSSSGAGGGAVLVEELLRDPVLADVALANECSASGDGVAMVAVVKAAAGGAAASPSAPPAEAPQKPSVPLRAGRYIIAFETLPTRNGETDYAPAPPATATSSVDAFGLAPAMGFMQALAKAAFGQAAPPEACCTYPLMPAAAADKH